MKYSLENLVHGGIIIKKRILSLFMACVMLISMAATGLSSITAFAYMPSDNVKDIIYEIGFGYTSITCSTNNLLNDDDINYIFSQPDVDYSYLKSFTVSQHPITDISIILEEASNLTELYASNCAITDISHVSKNEHLTTLYLDHNNLQTIDGITNLPNLSDVNFSYCNLTDVSQLAKLNGLRDLEGYTFLGQLILSHNNISDTSWLRELGVETLDLSYNNISNASYLLNLLYPNMYVVRSGDVYVDHNNLYRCDKEITEYLDYLSQLHDDYPPYLYEKSVVFKPYNNENFSLYNSEIKSQNFDDIKIDEAARTITFNSYQGANSLSCYNYGNSIKTSAFQFNIPENENISLTDNLYTFTRPVGSNKIVTTLTLKDTTNYYKTSQYTLIINFTVKGITALNNSPTVIDKNHGFIYGLQEGIKNLDGYIGAEEGNLQYVPTPKGFGTGATVQLTYNGEVMQTYTIVIFGDLNGDGVVDAFDQTEMVSTVNFETQYEENSSNKFAGDVNGDGVLDAFDLSIVTSASNYEISIDQSGFSNK